MFCSSHCIHLSTKHSRKLGGARTLCESKFYFPNTNRTASPSDKVLFWKVSMETQMPQKFGNSPSDIPQWQIAKYLTTILNQKKKDSPWTFIFNSKLEDTHNNTMSLRSQIQAHNRSLITCFGWHIILYLQNRYTPQASHLLKQGPQYSSPKHILTKSDLITQKISKVLFFPHLINCTFRHENYCR